MANTYSFELVTPERVLLSEEVIEINAPGSEGYLGVLAQHMPLLTALIPGEVRIRLADGRSASSVVISGGFLQISSSKTTILADAAQLGDEIDSASAQADLARARGVLAETESGTIAHANAVKEIAYAEALLRTARG